MKLFSKTFVAGAIAFFVGFGSLFGGQALMRAMNPSNVEEETTETKEANVSHQRMLLDNLLKMGTFKVDGGLNFKLEDNTLLKVNLDVTGDIADLNDIKLQGDANLYLNGINLDADFGYFKDADKPESKGTIYFSYKENNFYLETEHVLDFVNMLPTEYGIELDLPEGLKNLDLNTISSLIEGMEEKQSSNGDIYFVLNLEGVDLYVKSDSEYNIKGIRTDEINFKGNEISLDLSLEKAEDVELVAPNKNNYVNFKPAFNIFKSLYNLMNTKQGGAIIDANVAKLNKESEEYDSLVDATLDLGYDVENKSFQIDANLKENDREHKVGMLFEDKTAYLDIRTTKVSIQFESVTEAVSYILDQINFDITEKLMSSMTEVLNSDKFTDLRNGLNNLVGAIQISDDSFSIELDTDAIGLGMGKLTPVIKFSDNKFTAINLHDLVFKGYKVDVDLTFSDYSHKVIEKDDYVAFEPALTLVGAIMPLIKQTEFRIEFDALVDSTEADVKDITIDGGLQFKIGDEGFGYGKAVITDRDSYRHEIKADMKTKDEFLFSYNDTLNGKFSSKTLKELYSLVEDIIKNPDDHFIELFGELIESFKNSPIGKVLDGDYLAILDTELVNELVVDDTHLKMNISLGIIGMSDKTCDFEIFYHQDQETDKCYLDGISLSNLEIGSNVISFNAKLKEFDPSKEVERLDAYKQYLDFSDIKVLLQLGVNTSKFEYFHFNAKVDLSLHLLTDIHIKDMELDIQIRNNKGKVQVAVEIPEIPTINLLIINFNGSEDFSSTYKRQSSLYYDEGTFYTRRIEEGRPAFSTKHYRITRGATYTTEYFLDNVVTILLRDLLAVRSNWIDTILGDSSSESSETQIQYEKILKSFKYDESAGKFTFKIDLNALTHSSMLDTVDLDVYEDKATEQLTSVEVSLAVHVGLTLNVSLKLTTVDKQADLTDDNKLADLDYWAASREGAAINNWEKISKDRIN